MLRVIIAVCFCFSFSAALEAQWSPTNGPAGGTPTAFATITGGVMAGTVNGAYSSTDDGVHWTAAGLKGVSITHLLEFQSPDFSHVIFATSPRFAYRSSDAGKTWSQSFAAAGGMIAGMAQLNQNLFLALGPANDSLASGLYRSTNGGKDWSKLAGPTSFNDIQDVTSIGAKVIVATRNHGLFASLENGATWSVLAYPPLTSSFVLVQSNGAIYSGTNAGVVVSFDQGATWSKRITGGLDTLDKVEAIAINGRTVLALVAGRCFVSTDSGNTLQSSFFAPGSSSSSFSSVFYTGISYLSGNDAGITRSVDGATWVLSNTGENASNITNLISYKGTLYALTTLGGITRSTDQGQTWVYPTVGDLQDQVLFGLDTSGTDLFAYGFGLWKLASGVWQKQSDKNIPQLISHNGTFLYAQGDGSILRSTNQGVNWDTANAGRSNEVDQSSFLVRSGNNIVDVNEFLSPGHVGANTVFYLSTNDGASWRATDSLNERLGPTDAADGAQMTLVNAASGSELFASADHGVHWSLHKSFPPPGEDMNLLRPFRGGFVAYVTNRFGTLPTGFYKSSTGASWTNVGQGLDLNALVTSFTNDDKYLYAGIENSGVWRRDLSTVGVRQNYAIATGLSVYPNPASRSANLKFNLDIPGSVALKIYDARGVAVKELAEIFMTVGDHVLPVVIGDLPNGIYTITIEANQHQSESLLVIEH